MFVAVGSVCRKTLPHANRAVVTHGAMGYGVWIRKGGISKDDTIAIMRACIQRVSRARVTVGEEVAGEIGIGVLVLLGIAHDDDVDQARQMAGKIAGLRIFEDEHARMNLSLADAGGAMLVVSQFTLLGDCRKGRRPSFTAAAAPEQAESLYQVFVDAVSALGIPTATGKFRQHMEVELVNEGPVTLLLDTRDLERSRRSRTKE